MSFTSGRRFLPSLMRRYRFLATRIAEVLVMLAKKELVGHAGDIVANDDMARFHLREFFVGSRHRAIPAQVVKKKLFQASHGAIAVLGDRGMMLNVGDVEA